MDSMEKKQKEVMDLLMETIKSHHCVIESSLCKIGCHRSQHRLLMYLTMQDKSPSQREIADFFKISSAAVAVTLQKMERAGLIKKDAALEDGRANKICITKKGQKIVDVTKETFDSVDTQIFSGFCESDLDNLSSYLLRMKNNLKNISI